MRRVSRSLYSSLVLIVALALTVAAEAKGPPPGKGGGGEPTVDHSAAQALPIQLGSSGGNADDQANGYCCGGTLGSLVEIGGQQFILSNAHVFAGDLVSGGNGGVSTLGDAILQPGLIDSGCSASGASPVASLSDWSDLQDPGHNVDAAIAQVVPGAVRADGSILEIGPVSVATAPAVLNMPVKKSGRSSGLTQGTVAVLDATVTVGYSDECAGDSFTKTFDNQILVTPGRFIRSGDSGSLMVEDVVNLPRPVGLLFAGSQRVAVANPIDEVLAFFAARMVDGATADGAEVAVESARANARAAQQRASAELLRVPGAQGHGIGLSSRRPGELAIKLLVERISRSTIEAAPTEIDGVAVELMEVGRITAY
ncbi:hypothetical protein SAMN05216603_10810 [Pseudomonas benzenivorans]|nr:hypothetical protein [Pseudomonas benzenivorans]SDH31361.1 hypothetical protein SAMN05216603_10810 [Pseudomonas benzenivorans]